MRSAVICANGMATWLSCTLAEVRMKLTGMSPSIASRFALYPGQYSTLPWLFSLGASGLVGGFSMDEWRYERQGEGVA